VAIRSFSVGFAFAGVAFVSSPLDDPVALDRDGHALRPATPARALPVAWTASRLVIFPVDDIDISWNLLLGSKPH
jgi:hypothetical protein